MIITLAEFLSQLSTTKTAKAKNKDKIYGLTEEIKLLQKYRQRIALIEEVYIHTTKTKCIQN